MQCEFNGEGLLHKLESLSIWRQLENPSQFFYWDIFRSVNSPSSIIGVHRKGSLLELAALLGSIFLGMGLKVYLGIGKVINRPYVWVITHQLSDKPHEEVNAPLEVRYKGNSFKIENFEKHAKIQAIRAINSKHQWKHWDILSGIL